METLTAGGIDLERMTRTFLDLVRLDSPSRREGRVARYVQAELERLGLKVREDEAGRKAGGECGNILGRLPSASSGRGRVPILLSAHMDTVQPGEGIQPVAEAGRIRSDGRTILGGDCKSGIAVILEALRVLREGPAPHGEIEVAMTICEEVGLLGAKHLDASFLHSKVGIVLDSPNAHEVTVRAPTSNHIDAVLEGREAHSGVCPEKGVSAIQIAAEAVRRMKLGRVDRETTSNMGLIQGGIATNIIPPRVEVHGEARSLSPAKLKVQTRHLKSCFVAAARKFKGKAVVKIENSYPSLNISPKAAMPKLLGEAARRLGHKLSFVASGGASDANVFSRHGLQTVNLGTGMRDIHTVREWLDLADFEFSARLLVEALRLHAAGH